MAELRVGFMFNLLTEPSPRRSSYVLMPLTAQSANTGPRARAWVNSAWVGEAACHPGLPSLGSPSLLGITQARRWPKGLYEIHGTFNATPSSTSCTEHLQVKAMGLFCPWMLLISCGVIPGQRLGQKLWFAKPHIWLLKVFNISLPGLFCETALMS